MSTTPDVPLEPTVPLRVEMVFELPGSPEQVWEAIATAHGMSAWFLPTDADEREGGEIVFHMGETDSRATITSWEPPYRIVYAEPDWAGLAGHEGADVTPLMSEFLVEATSGGTCVLRVVSSAFGTGADWEQEFIESMEASWRPSFDLLGLYLSHFPGQHATRLVVESVLPGAEPAVRAAVRAELGNEVGQEITVRGLSGRVERADDIVLLVRLFDPIPGYIGATSHDLGDGSVLTNVSGYLFSESAAAYVEREQPEWKAWLDSLGVSAA